MVKEYMLKDAFVTAVQYTGKNIEEVYELGANISKDHGMLVVQEDTLTDVIIKPVNIGDYLVKMANGYVFKLSEVEFKRRYFEIDERTNVCTTSFY